MSGATLSEKEFELHLKNLGDKDLRPLLQRLRLAIISAISDRFQTSKGPDGVPWPHLAFRRITGGDRPLLDTGNLMASCISAAGSGHYENMTDHSFEIGTNRVDARIHQEGGTITPKKGKFLAIPKTMQAKGRAPRQFGSKLTFRGSFSGGVLVDRNGEVQYALAKSVTVPARPFMGWSDELVAECNKIILDYAKEKLGGRK